LINLILEIIIIIEEIELILFILINYISTKPKAKPIINPIASIINKRHTIKIPIINLVLFFIFCYDIR